MIWTNPRKPIDNKITPSFHLEVSAIPDSTQNTLIDDKEIYPTLFGIKTTNARANEQPTPVGWLYYVDREPYKILYASGTPDNMKELFTWDKTVTHDGNSTPKNYMPFITKSGDILFVFRGEQVPGTSPNPNARQNPILYPAGDYENPVKIDFGSEIKPTSWLQNCGADYIYSQDCLIFTEYTRQVHAKCYVWKVTPPFTNPSNWRIVKEFDVSGHAWQGFKHAHTINYDPYSTAVYLTTGDENEAAYIYESRDFGETWVTRIAESEKEARLLNFIFTKDKIYWASDSGKINYHSLFEVKRGEDGYPDFATIKELWAFPYKEKKQATYVSALINDPPGILFLDRFDNPTSEKLDIYFWSFETESAHTVRSFYPLDGQELELGFRCEATNWYQAPSDSRIVCGFGYYPNEMEVLNNMLGTNENRVCNLALKVIRK